MLVIVNVPPTTSSGPSCLLFARAARSRISRAMRRSRLPSALRITGAIRPLKSRSTAIPRLQVAVHDERLAVDARVDVRVVVHDVAERAHDERQVREREALLGLPRGLVRAAGALDALEVDAHRRVDVRARRLRPHHVLGGAAPDVVERHDLVARRRARPAARARRAARRGRGRRGARRGRGRRRRAAARAPRRARRCA